jgi:hypothetical protein
MYIVCNTPPVTVTTPQLRTGPWHATTVARGIALYGGFGEVPNVGSRKCKKPEIFNMAFEGLRHHLNVL